MKTFRFIADYTDKKGRNYFQPFIVADITNQGLQPVIRKVKHILKKDKYRLIAITEVFDDTANLEDLFRIAKYPQRVKMTTYVFDKSALKWKPVK